MSESSTPDKLEAIMRPDPELEGCIDALLTELLPAADEDSSLEIGDRDLALFERYRATTIIAERLADRVRGDKAAQALVVLHRAKGEDTPTALYAYWGVARKMTEDHPDSLIPRGFLNFLLDLGQKVDAKDLLPEINDLIIGLRIEPEIKDEKSFPETPLEWLQDLADSSWGEFMNEARAEKEAFEDLVLEIHEEAYSMACPHSDDYIRIVNKSAIYLTDLKDLSQGLGLLEKDIGQGEFFTDTEYVDAQVMYDEVRLRMRGDDKSGLLRDIRKNRFLSGVGMDAAMAKNDQLRLSGSVEEILRDIEKGRFVTPLGLSTAQRYCDAERLQAVSHWTNYLFVDIWQGEFLTRAGVKAAEKQHDMQRLASYEDRPQQLLMDLQGGTFLFFTDEGKTKVQEMLAGMDANT